MKLTPFEFNRLYGNEKYNLNNMLLKMVNYPAKIDTDVDKVYEVYSDRAQRCCDVAWKILKSRENADAFLHGTSDESFLKFCGKMFALIEKEQQFTGRYKGLHAVATKDVAEDDYTRRIKIDEQCWQKAADEIEPLVFTGALAIRFTNMGGYPIVMFSAVIQKSNQPTYSGNNAPFVRYPGEEFGGRRRSRYGMLPDINEYGEF